MSFFILLLLLWVSVLAALVLYFHKDFRALWREPCLRRPVLVFESDDWGAGPGYQARALRELYDLLLAYRDRDGRAPVVTLALVLAAAKGGAQHEGYGRITLAAPRFDDLREILRRGRKAGVYALQLHGMEHYWPQSLMRAAQCDADVAQWLRSSPDEGTEVLPSHLQSRWVDASQLPARAHPEAEMQRAAMAEVELFAALFRSPPQVGVPPTFVWNATVERAWQAAGVRVLVTPGRRFYTRDADGRPVPTGDLIYNGATSESGLMYLVRDDYFEPEKGHRAERALEALRRKTSLARPTLLEMHRSNFADPEERRRTLTEIRAVIENALGEFGDLAFIAPQQLAQYIETSDPQWIEQGFGSRLHVFCRRIQMLPRARKLFLITGVFAPLWFILKITNAPRT